MEDGRNVGMPGEVCIAFKEFLAEILSGDRLPTRVRREFKTTMDIFLETMKNLVEEEGDYRFVLDNIGEVQKIISDEWKQKPFIKEFIDRTEEYRIKAQALVEFFNMDILVSGLVWLPNDAASKRIAIVNDMAILEGEVVPIQRKRPPKAGESPAPVSLEFVGRDRFVWFGYKGLRIKYPLGKRPEKKGPTKRKGP
jgi:hypothetical protein